MFGQLVLGVLLVQFQHVAVTADLGQDGCCRDGRTVGIALDDGFCRLGKAGRAAVAIDEHMIRPEVQPCYGLRHAVHSSPEDIALVDLLWRDEDDLIGKGTAGDLVKQSLAALLGQLFGVVDPLDGVIRVQDDGGTADRPAQGAAARFVYAADNTMGGALFGVKGVKGITGWLSLRRP